VITLNENEERLVEVLRSLPADAADHVYTWVLQLHDLANGQAVDWSDTWIEDDLADARRASLERFDRLESEDL
jgi:hypothetical protein